jgi:hypothetical protein
MRDPMLREQRRRGGNFVASRFSTATPSIVTAMETSPRFAVTFAIAFTAACGAGTGTVDSGVRDAARHDVRVDTPEDVVVSDIVPIDSITMTDASGDTACAIVEGHAGVVRLPLDVIVVVDSSPSFDTPRAAISDILAPSLIAELERESIDYRVIVVGGAITAPPATDPPRYFYVSQGVGSTDLLGALPMTYLRVALPNLRTDSLKAIVDFTDATSPIGTADEFYTGMTAPELVPYFGDASMRRYFVHTVAGLANNMPTNVPWPPSAAIVDSMCTGFSATPAQELQRVSIDTGGYRFALCNTSEYGPFFDAVAQQAISRVQVPCEFEQPTTSSGATPDIMYAVMTVHAGGADRTYRVLDSMSECGDGFYLANNPDAGAPARVVLCPTTCAAVRADSMATVNFAFECPPG